VRPRTPIDRADSRVLASGPMEAPLSLVDAQHARVTFHLREIVNNAFV
jgi:hypothetical protein